MRTRSLLAVVIALSMLFLPVAFVMAGGEQTAVQDTVLSGVIIGELEAWTPGYGPFVVEGEGLSLIYHDRADLVRDYQGIQLWVGGVYHPQSFHDLNFTGERHVGVNTAPPEANCGLMMLSVGVRPITTGKMLYTNLLLPRYSAPELMEVVFGENLSANVSSNASLVSLESEGHAYLEFSLPEESERECSEFSLRLQGKEVMPFTQAPVEGVKACFVSLYGRSEFLPVSGGISLEVSPYPEEMIPGTWYQGQLRFVTLNWLGPKWCGGPR